MKVLFVVTHLLGSGHLSRALTLARAFEAAGHSSVVASGGMPAPHLNTEGLTFVQLPPLRSDGVNFTRLLDQNGVEATAGHYGSRQAQLIALLDEAAPDVVITELFPFGRRSLRKEFIGVLNAARDRTPRPLVLASIRDILAPPSKPKKAVFAQEMVAQFYDAVLVHADPEITPLSLSWPVEGVLAPALRYTGFVAPAPARPHKSLAGEGEIIVTAGGGDVGNALFACAKRAALEDPNRVWRLLIGGAQSEQRIALLNDGAPANLIAQGARRDFRQMLHHAAASVSMCGYNTALDILQTSCPAVFVPFDDGTEVEQGLRAQALGTLSGIEVVRTADMTPAALLGAVDAACAAPPRPARPVMEGAAETVRIVAHMRAARP